MLVREQLPFPVATAKDTYAVASFDELKAVFSGCQEGTVENDRPTPSGAVDLPCKADSAW